MVLGLGPAGTGKTYVAASHAIDELVSDRTGRIVVTRATVPVDGEKLGFLPGTADEKMDPWVAELFDIFRERVGEDRFKTLIRERRIQIVPFAFMRGRSFRDSIIICDEMQNATPAQAKMLVTRIGEGSSMLINGDLDQSDLRGRNGLQDLVDMIEDQGLMVPVVRFTKEDVRRSALCRMWVEAYERKEAA